MHSPGLEWTSGYKVARRCTFLNLGSSEDLLKVGGYERCFCSSWGHERALRHLFTHRLLSPYILYYLPLAAPVYSGINLQGKDEPTN